MREKIAGRGLLAGDRIIHLELREVGADGLVPVDLTFVSEDAEGESREGFGDRADGKQGCGRDREFVFEIAIAESFGVDDFAVLYDGQGDARDFPRSEEHRVGKECRCRCAAVTEKSRCTNKSRVVITMTDK